MGLDEVSGADFWLKINSAPSPIDLDGFRRDLEIPKKSSISTAMRSEVGGGGRTSHRCAWSAYKKTVSCGVAPNGFFITVRVAAIIVVAEARPGMVLGCDAVAMRYLRKK